MRTSIAQSKNIWYAVIFCWAMAAVGVWVWTTSYGFSNYEESRNYAIDRWPRETSLLLAKDRPTLVFFMHPRCPCTRASIGELERLLTGPGRASRQQPRLIVVATIPLNASSEWRHTDTIRRIARLPHARLVWDIEGTESNRFGAVASGVVMLYDPSGTRLFAGGVTASRGHEGGNVGSDRVWEILSGQNPSRQDSTPTFGCKLCIAPSKSDSSAPCDAKSGRGSDSGPGASL